MKTDPKLIDALAELFTGPAVATHSIGLNIPATERAARHFFEARKALGIEGYASMKEGRAAIIRALTP